MRESLQVGLAVGLVLCVALACKPRKRIVEDPPPPPVDTSTTTSSDPDPDDDDDNDPKAASTTTATATATAHATKVPPTPTVTPTHAATHAAQPQHQDPPCFGGDHPKICNGVCVKLATDDNNCGACGYKCPPGKHCDGHLFCRDAQGNL